ncbi:MAG: TraR/DksA C4-type zinc finger protein [Acidimicrobiia bacterium]|nr:TraR/DksA C4-type zinc finger protein [Acidimicrobiia bacterium]
MSLRDRLQVRRDELAAELDRLTEPPEAGATVGFGKRVGDGTTEAVERISSTLTARSIAMSLAEVDRALEKLADGTYGSCDSCGERIATARMEAMPSKVICVECAARS